MIRRQDISVLLVYYSGYSTIRNLLLRLRKKPVTRILVFHEISNESLKYFEDNLRFLVKNTNVVSLDDFFMGNLASKRTNIIITFDDGFQNWVNNAIPVLNKLRLPAIFFVTSGFVGLSKAEATEFNKTKLFRSSGKDCDIESLNSKDLKRMIADGFVIGGHTINHSNLGMYRDQNRLRNEIIEDKNRLEKMTGVTSNYFAYPKGVYNNPFVDVPEVIKQAGYKGAVTTVPGLNTIKTNPYLLHRELTRASMPKRVFKARVYGNYDLILGIKRFVSMLLKWYCGKSSANLEYTRNNLKND